ncbi:MAG: HNH endonuclease [Candidatus Acidiferrales bacterium]
MGKKSRKVRLPADLRQRIRAVRAKRPRTVLEHILKNGYVTTEELQDLYGYEHPPRAAQDVKEHGIPLETYRVPDKKGRKIAAYRLNLAAIWEQQKAGGRKAFSKKFKAALLGLCGNRCASCGAVFDPRYLQIDHRVPYHVAGEASREQLSEFMLLCPSCNRTKSWTCEQCLNWRGEKRVSVCQSCYWGNPDKHTHVALAEIRRVALTWVGQEVGLIDTLHALCEAKGTSIQEGIKQLVRQEVSAK